METDKSKTQIFLVLVPHTDARYELQKHSDSLIKNGLSDAYPFPHAAPLAELSKSLNDDELKKTARALRETAGKEKFRAEETSSISIKINNKEMALNGFKLDLCAACASGIAAGKIKKIFSPVIIGEFLNPKGAGQNVRDGLCASQPKNYPDINFRAAAVANMHWKPININGEYYFKWKIGKLFWLPRPKKSLQKSPPIQ